jgi:hypothetical protein
MMKDTTKAAPAETEILRFSNCPMLLQKKSAIFLIIISLDDGFKDQEALILQCSNLHVQGQRWHSKASCQGFAPRVREKGGLIPMP